METLFIVFAFIGMYGCGFFTCMLITFGVIMHKQEKQLRRKNWKEGTDDGNNGAQYRSRNIFGC